MIVLDEQLKDAHLLAAIANWYRGGVTHIGTLRPDTVIKDDNIPEILMTAQTPTFITINVSDFWRKVEAHADYCIIAIDMPQANIDDLPARLRKLFNTPQLKTKALRMGKIVRVQTNKIRYYDRGKQIRQL